MNVSPALAGSGSSDWRVMSNFKTQTVGGNPLSSISINTTSLSFDGRIVKQPYRSSNYVAMGLMVLQDAGLGGAYKNNNAHLAISSHVSLDEEDNHGLCVGLGVLYNNTIINSELLNFPNQISFTGFDNSIYLEDMTSIMQNAPKNNFRVTAGICYTYTSEKSNLSIGVSGFRFNSKNISRFGNSKVSDYPRYNFHADFQTYLNDQIILNANTLYIMENYTNTTIVGANIGRIMSMEDIPTVLNVGLWYRQNTVTVVAPYVGIMYKNMQAGITYDINIKDNKNEGLLKTIELSLIFRKPGKTGRLMDSFGK